MIADDFCLQAKPTYGQLRCSLVFRSFVKSVFSSFKKNVESSSPVDQNAPCLWVRNQISPVFLKFLLVWFVHILLSLPYFDHITFRGKHRRKVNYWFSSNCWRRNYYFWNQCFLHWKGEVRLSSASHVIRPGKSFPNFNSKFSANLDFKEFELRPLNLQQVYVPCQIKGALAFQTHSSKRFVFLRIIQMFDASWHDCIYHPYSQHGITLKLQSRPYLASNQIYVMFFFQQQTPDNLPRAPCIFLTQILTQL